MKKQLKLIKKSPVEEGNNKKGEKTYEEILQEIKNSVELLAADYIPELCTALKRKNPLISSVAIRATVIKDVAKPNGPWKENTIRLHWPEWLKNSKTVAAGKASSEARKLSKSNLKISQQDLDDWEKKVREVRERGKEYGLTEEEIQKDEESVPIKSWTQDEYEEEHPEVAESPFEIIGEINRALARLWTALTKQKNMLTREVTY